MTITEEDGKYTILTESFPSSVDAAEFVQFTNDFTILNAEVILAQPSVVRLWSDYEDSEFDGSEGHEPKDALVEYMMRYKVIAKLV